MGKSINFLKLTLFKRGKCLYGITKYAKFVLLVEIEWKKVNKKVEKKKYFF